MSVLVQLRARQTVREDQALADAIAERWRIAAEAVLGVACSTVVGVSVSVPPLMEILLTPPVELVVAMLPGQVVADYELAAPRLAPHLACRAVRVAAVGLVHVRLTLLTGDPLDGALVLEVPDCSALLEAPVVIGCGERGDQLEVDPAALPHIAVQGQTRAGKTHLVYSTLAQLAPRPTVRVAGVDPSGLTLRVFNGSRHAPWQCVGPQSPAAVADLVRKLVDEMDARLARIPDDLDVLPISTADPLTVCTFEEYPGTLRRLDMLDPKGAAVVVRDGMARLLSESHKVGYRLLLLAQRFEAKLVGSDVRAQCAGRISLRVDNLDTLKLLHTPEAAAAHIGEHATAASGIAVVDWPGHPTQRLRVPTVGSYARYRQLVAA